MKKYDLFSEAKAQPSTLRVGEQPGTKTHTIPEEYTATKGYIILKAIENTKKQLDRAYKNATTPLPPMNAEGRQKAFEAFLPTLTAGIAPTMSLGKVSPPKMKEVAPNIFEKIQLPTATSKTNALIPKKEIPLDKVRGLVHSPEKTIVDMLMKNYSTENVSRILRNIKDPAIRKNVSREIAIRIRDTAKHSGDYFTMTGNVSSDIPRTAGFQQNVGVGKDSPDYVVPNGSWTEGRGYYSTILDNFKKTGSFYSNPATTGRSHSKLHLNLIKNNGGQAPLGWDLNQYAYPSSSKRVDLFDKFAYKPVGLSLKDNPELKKLANQVAFNDWLKYSEQKVKAQLPYDTKTPMKFLVKDGVPTLEHSYDTEGAMKRIRAAAQRFKLASGLSPIDVPIDMNNRFYSRGDYEGTLNFLSSPENVIKIASKRVSPPYDSNMSVFGHHGDATQYASSAIDKLINGSGWEKNAYYVNHPKEAANLYGYPLNNDVLKEFLSTDVVHRGVDRGLIDRLIGLK